MCLFEISNRHKHSAQIHISWETLYYLQHHSPFYRCYEGSTWGQDFKEMQETNVKKLSETGTTEKTVGVVEAGNIGTSEVLGKGN